MVEYALILVLIAIVAIIAVTAVGQQTSDTFSTVSSALSATNGTRTYSDDFKTTLGGAGVTWNEFGDPGSVTSGSGLIISATSGATGATGSAQEATDDHMQGVYEAAPTAPFTVTADLSSASFTDPFQTAMLFVGPSTFGTISAPCTSSSVTFATAAVGFVATDVEAGGWDYCAPNPTEFSSSNPGAWTDYNSSNVAPIPDSASATYLKIAVAASGTINEWVSMDNGTSYTTLGSFNPGFEIGSIGLAIDNNSQSTTQSVTFGWIHVTTS
jgi:Flp pilus assembly pilin Flp